MVSSVRRMEREGTGTGQEAVQAGESGVVGGVATGQQRAAATGQNNNNNTSKLGIQVAAQPTVGGKKRKLVENTALGRQELLLLTIM